MMNILIQGSLVGLVNCLAWGGTPYIVGKDYVGCWADKVAYHRIMSKVQQTNYVFGVGSR